MTKVDSDCTISSKVFPFLDLSDPGTNKGFGDSLDSTGNPNTTRVQQNAHYFVPHFSFSELNFVNDCKLSDILGHVGHLGPTVCRICFVVCALGPSVYFLGHEEPKKDQINV